MNINTNPLGAEGGPAAVPSAAPSSNGPASADQRFVEALVERAALNDSAAARALRAVVETGECIVGALVKLGYLSEGAAADAQAQHLHLERASSGDFPSVAIELSDVSKYFLREHEAVPLEIHDGEVVVAVWNAFDDFTSSALAFACEMPVIQRVATRTEIEVALRTLYPVGEQDEERGATGTEGFLDGEPEIPGWGAQHTQVLPRLEQHQYARERHADVLPRRRAEWRCVRRFGDDVLH